MRRRSFLAGCCAAAVASAVPATVFFRPLAAASRSSNEVLVYLFLRGGMDGLHLVVPYAGAERGHYELLRENLAIPEANLRQIDTHWALHPRAGGATGDGVDSTPKWLHRLWNEGHLAIVQGGGMPDNLSRSHFDAQAWMDLGTPGDKSTIDGWLTRYSDPGQIGAGRGYAVFYPNYRGSTGRGVAYAKAHQDDYGGKEFNELVDAVNALAEEGIIDADRAGITGGSYGGYASMWGATALSEHFAASVAFVGISNQLSKFGTTDIPNEMYHVHSRRWPWEDNWMNLLKRSPIYHVGEATTPTLILHGEEDTRVHPSQSMELYRSMKVRTDTPVRLVFYPGEGHGNRKAAAQADYAMRMMRWMDQYLARGAKRDAEKPDFDLGLMERFDEDKADSEE